MPKKGNSSISDRLHRIEGQIRGVEKMMNNGQDLNKVMTQLQAVISSLESVKLAVVKQQIAKQMEEDVFDALDLLK